MYESITAIVSDMRLILENCYRYNGSTHWVSKLAHKLEKILDQKLALLNRFVLNKGTSKMLVEANSGLLDKILKVHLHAAICWV